jgi:hypothetical protein
LQGHLLVVLSLRAGKLRVRSAYAPLQDEDYQYHYQQNSSEHEDVLERALPFSVHFQTTLSVFNGFQPV